MMDQGQGQTDLTIAYHFVLQWRPVKVMKAIVPVSNWWVTTSKWSM